nr:CU044_2847 family protein [Paenarthrobacter aurescens]
MRYEVGSGTVLVEVDDDSYGVDHPARNEQGILNVDRRLEDALASVRPAAVAALESMRELAPEHMEIEFGIKLAGDAGALIAKSCPEGHFIVRMSWSTEHRHAGGTELNEHADALH